MAKNDNDKQEIKDNYYELKHKAIDDLVNADSSNSPEVSEEELEKYSSHKKLHLPSWFTVVFIKFWFSASICYFFLWGLGGYLKSIIDQLFVLATAMGIITDLLTNNAIRFFAKSKGGYDKWMLFPKKSYKSFLGNILYSFVIIFLVYTFYTAINLAIIKINGGDANTMGMGVEPLLFGILCTAADMMFIGLKNLLYKVINDAKQKVTVEK